ncbi:hypothetical protein EBR57_06495 [bacterium]|nr:hypothetical protein [bacterium]
MSATKEAEGGRLVRGYGRRGDGKGGIAPLAGVIGVVTPKKRKKMGNGKKSRNDSKLVFFSAKVPRTFNGWGILV